jgi:hypothetical protein
MARGISGRRQHDSNRIDNEGADCRVGEIRQFVAWSIFLSFRIVKEVATMKSWLRILRSKCRNAR